MSRNMVAEFLMKYENDKWVLGDVVTNGWVPTDNFSLLNCKLFKPKLKRKIILRY